MLRLSKWLMHTSTPLIGTSGGSSLTYTDTYRKTKKYDLHKKYLHVTDGNRYESLKIIFEELLTGYACRRQYKYRIDEGLCNISRIVELLVTEGLDWHDIKALNSSELIDLCDVMQLSYAEKMIFLTAVESRICGVLTRNGKDHDPRTICTRFGKEKYGWRCGIDGHVNGAYFEGMFLANEAALAPSRKTGLLSLPPVEREQLIASAKRESSPAILLLQSGSTSSAAASEGILSGQKKSQVINGVCVEQRPAPDFRIVGRMAEWEELARQPRVWPKRPFTPCFHVTVIGFEFRVHPDDPRVEPQILESASDWDAHGEIIANVVWEMLELYGVERDAQPLDVKPGDLGEPDSQYEYTSAFSGTQAGETGEQVIVERQMMTSSGDSIPWFIPPLPQHFVSNVPKILPFAPTLIVKCSYVPVEESIGLVDDPSKVGDLVEKRLRYPLLDLTVLKHPDACFWWSSDSEEKALQHILRYAKKVPYALPFNFYIRVDPSRILKPPIQTSNKESTQVTTSPNVEDGSKFFKEIQGRLKRTKKKYFDLANYGECALRATDPKYTEEMHVSMESDSYDESSPVTEVILEEKEFKDTKEYQEDNSNSAVSTMDDMLFPDINPPGWE